MMQDVHMKLNPGFPWQTQHSARRKLFSTVNWKELVNCYIWSIAFCGDGTWTVRKVVQKYLEGLKCGAGEGWGRSVGPIV
jgi:hypothetical protein